MAKAVFYWSKKKRSCGVFSADLHSSEETPLHGVIVPLYLRAHVYCKSLKVFFGVSMEKISHALFLQLLKNVSRSYAVIKLFDPGCARAVLLQLCVLTPPCDNRVIPLISGALCCLMSCLMNHRSWS